jgi:hypothetical protein
MSLKAYIDLNHGFAIEKNTLSGGAFSTSYNWADADGLNWYNRVVGVGGSITNANQAVFDTAFQSMKANANVWAKINQGYFFIGQQEFGTGLFVPFYNSNAGSGVQPLYTSPATNVNIPSSSYSKQVGISNLDFVSGINTGIPNRNSNWPSTSDSAGRSAYTFISGINDYGPIIAFGMARTYSSNRFFSYEGYYQGPAEDPPQPPLVYAALDNNAGDQGVLLEELLVAPTFPLEGGCGIPDNRDVAGGNYYLAGTQYSGTIEPSSSPVSPLYDNGTMTIASYSYSQEFPEFLVSDTHTIVASAFGVGGLDIPSLDAIVVTLRSNLT